jgi:hypothetical protein
VAPPVWCTTIAFTRASAPFSIFLLILSVTLSETRRPSTRLVFAALAMTAPTFRPLPGFEPPLSLPDLALMKPVPVQIRRSLHPGGAEDSGLRGEASLFSPMPPPL